MTQWWTMVHELYQKIHNEKMINNIKELIILPPIDPCSTYRVKGGEEKEKVVENLLAILSE